MSTLILPLKKLISPFKVDGILPNLFVFIPRFLIGILLSFFYAPQKFGTPWTAATLNLNQLEVADWFVQIVANFGTPFNLMPVAFAWSAVFTEFLGGIFFILGFNTRITAFFITIVMAITIYYRPLDDSWNILPVFIMYCVGLFTLGFGSGKFGLDYFISQKFKS